jgi:hypothetical protein
VVDTLERGKTAQRRALGRARTARYRQNRLSGAAVAPVIFTAEIIDYLIKLHWLADADVHDRHKIGEAISRLLAASAKKL